MKQINNNKNNNNQLKQECELDHLFQKKFQIMKVVVLDLKNKIHKYIS